MRYAESPPLHDVGVQNLRLGIIRQAKVTMTSATLRSCA